MLLSGTDLCSNYGDSGLWGMGKRGRGYLAESDVRECLEVQVKYTRLSMPHTQRTGSHSDLKSTACDYAGPFIPLTSPSSSQHPTKQTSCGDIIMR